MVGNVVWVSIGCLVGNDVGRVLGFPVFSLVSVGDNVELIAGGVVGPNVGCVVGISVGPLAGFAVVGWLVCRTIRWQWRRRFYSPRRCLIRRGLLHCWNFRRSNRRT